MYVLVGKFGGGDGILKQIAFGGESKYFGKLPLGPDYNDYKMNCFTRIKDKASSYTSVDLGEIQVNKKVNKNKIKQKAEHFCAVIL